MQRLHPSNRKYSAKAILQAKQFKSVKNLPLLTNKINSQFHHIKYFSKSERRNRHLKSLPLHPF